MTKKPSALIYLDPDMLAWLKAEAQRRRCSVSMVVRDLVLAGMKAADTGV